MWAHRKSRDTVVLMPEVLTFWYTYHLVGPQFLLLGGTIISQLTVFEEKKGKRHTKIYGSKCVLCKIFNGKLYFKV